MGMRALAEKIPASPRDSVNFGAHAEKTYQDVKSMDYAKWVVTTYEEGGGATGECDWRLKRLAQWLISQEVTGKTIPRREETKGYKKKPLKEPASASGMSDSSFMAVNFPANEAPVPDDSEEEMLSDTECKIQDLENQLRDLQRRKKEKVKP